MKIGIFSDSHSKVDELKNALDFLVQNGAEFIIHAGDICRVEALELLENSPLKYVCVYGNNDAKLIKYQNDYNLVQEPNYFKVANTKFKLMHLPFYMSGDAEIVIYGHTHIHDCEFKNNTLFLNPGEICAREKPLVEFVMLDVNSTNFRVQYFTNYTLEKSYSFDRNL